MVALFLDDNKTKDDGDGKEIGRNNMFILTNTCNKVAKAVKQCSIHFLSVEL